MCFDGDIEFVVGDHSFLWKIDIAAFAEVRRLPAWFRLVVLPVLFGILQSLDFFLCCSAEFFN